MVKITPEPEAVTEISEVPPSANTVSRRVRNMSSDIEIIFRENTNLGRKLSLQIDQSTGISGHTQLIANIRYSDGDITTSTLFFSTRNFQREQPAISYFVLQINIFAKMDCNGRAAQCLHRCSERFHSESAGSES
jgi:hypothetical protein